MTFKTSENPVNNNSKTVAEDVERLLLSTARSVSTLLEKFQHFFVNQYSGWVK